MLPQVSHLASLDKPASPSQAEGITVAPTLVVFCENEICQYKQRAWSMLDIAAMQETQTFVTLPVTGDEQSSVSQ